MKKLIITISVMIFFVEADAKAYSRIFLNQNLLNIESRELIVRFQNGVSTKARMSIHKKIGTKYNPNRHLLPQMDLVRIPENLNVHSIHQQYERLSEVKYVVENHRIVRNLEPIQEYVPSIYLS